MTKTIFIVADDKKTLRISRLINATKDKVWSAYADKEMLRQWFSTDGWETKITHFDFTDGGYWHYCMTCTDPEQTDWFGKESWGKGIYDNIKPKDSFEITDIFCDANETPLDGMPIAHTLHIFEEEGDKTKLTFIVTYENAEALQQVLTMGMQEGLIQAVAKLTKLVEAK